MIPSLPLLGSIEKIEVTSTVMTSSILYVRRGLPPQQTTLHAVENTKNNTNTGKRKDSSFRTMGPANIRTFLCILVATLLKTCAAAVDEVHGHLRLRSDPDTTCSDAFRKNPTDDACLTTHDHFGRPCELCKIGKSDTVECYNADQAKWAKFFGGSCQTAPQ